MKRHGAPNQREGAKILGGTVFQLGELSLPNGSLKAYPNACGDRIQVQVQGQVGDLSEWWVTDATGRRVWSASEVIGGDGTMQWNLETAS
jgi:hypothetical protein